MGAGDDHRAADALERRQARLALPHAHPLAARLAPERHPLLAAHLAPAQPASTAARVRPFLPTAPASTASVSFRAAVGLSMYAMAPCAIFQFSGAGCSPAVKHVGYCTER